jgi:hypothetical protein
MKKKTFLTKGPFFYQLLSADFFQFGNITHFKGKEK